MIQIEIEDLDQVDFRPVDPIWNYLACKGQLSGYPVWDKIWGSIRNPARRQISNNLRTPIFFQLQDDYPGFK
jgi:hypothetical protein